MTWINGAHMTLEVVVSPVDWMSPGDEYLRGDIAIWLEDGMLPVGLVLHATVDWEVVKRDGRFMLRSQGRSPRSLLDAMGLRRYRRGKTRYRVLATIHDMIMRNGEPPSIRQLAAEMGCGQSLVQYHIDILAADGFLDRTPGAYRSARLSEAGQQVIGYREGTTSG